MTDDQFDALMARLERIEAAILRLDPAAPVLAVRNPGQRMLPILNAMAAGRKARACDPL